MNADRPTPVDRLLYVAGPMTGLPELNHPAFRAAAHDLAEAGYAVLDPSRHGGSEPGRTYESYLRMGLRDVLECDAVAVLDGWEMSRGARAEVGVAQALSMPVRPVAEWLTDAAMRWWA